MVLILAVHSATMPWPIQKAFFPIADDAPVAGHDVIGMTAAGRIGFTGNKESQNGK
jgi:hypothetical protein